MKKRREKKATKRKKEKGEEGPREDNDVELAEEFSLKFFHGG